MKLASEALTRLHLKIGLSHVTALKYEKLFTKAGRTWMEMVKWANQKLWKIKEFLPVMELSTGQEHRGEGKMKSCTRVSSQTQPLSLAVLLPFLTIENTNQEGGRRN